ncbi:MAG: T9SS type A sorting domain-containing protein [Saprospiraceae bacterium]|nr:T9SS type A sorting domain-containing protein [Candidatus Defluviibacterium haderslevense]
MYARIYFLALLLIISNANTNAQSWKALNGPTGAGTVASIITYEKGEIYTLITSGKMFRSLDNAQTWENISAGLQQIASRSNYDAQMKESPTGEIFMSSDNLLYKFIPASNSWITVSEDIGIGDFGFSPDGKTIYAANYDEFNISVNGSKFNKIQTWGSPSVEFLCLGNNNNFVRKTAGASGEIWKFNDDGSQLRLVTGSSCCRSMFFHKKSKTLFDIDYQIRISKDFGLTWVNLVLQDNLYFDKMLELEDGSILGFLNYKIYKSIDDGKSWIEDNNYDLSNFYVGSDAFLSKSKKDEVVISDFQNSCYLDNKGYNYTFEMPVLEPGVSEIVQFGEKNIFCKTSSNRQLSMDDGLTWKILPSNINYNNLFWKDGTMAYYTDDSIIVSTDQFNTQHTKTHPRFINSTNFFMDNNENLVLLGSDKSYISYDKGDSWKLIGENLEIPTSVAKFKISKQNIIYGGSNMDTIYYSVDYGITWKGFYALPDAIIGYEVFLSANNVFLWQEIDQISFENVYKYSADFGATNEVIKIQNDERILLIDDYDNVYASSSQNVNSLKVTNILTKQVSYISLNGFNLFVNEGINVIRGNNGYLYATRNKSPLYMYSEKFQNELGLISGKVFIDEHQDCAKSSTEVNTIAFQLEVSGSRTSIEVPVLAEGNFKVFLALGDYKLNLKSKSLIWEQCNFPTQVNVQANMESQYNELLVKPNEYCADLSTNVVLSRLRRCFDNNFAYLTIKNDGSISSKNTIVTVFMDDYFEKIQSSLIPTTVNGNLWTFNISEIKPGETFRINFKFTVSCKASINQEHCIKYITENEQACKGFSSLMDTSIVCEKNIGSFDPNDKTVLVNGKSTDFLYEKDSILEYLIRFQNTGTDTAFNIKLTDKLDYNLDWTSLIALTASHDYTYSVNEQGLLEVNFKDIMLADSNISEANSHGYFKFSIKPKPNLNYGTLINNVADIYFDFNEAVRTNFAKLTLTPILKTKNIVVEKIIELKAIPNPANQVTEIAIPESWHNAVVHARVLSLDGKLVQSFDISTNKIILKRKNLSSGMYYLNLINKEGKRAYCKIIFN